MTTQVWHYTLQMRQCCCLPWIAGGREKVGWCASFTWPTGCVQGGRDDRWKCANVHFWFWVQLLFHALFHVRIVFITVAQNCKVKHSLMVAALNYICLLYIIAILQAMTRTIICMTLISNFITNDAKF